MMAYGDLIEIQGVPCDGRKQHEHDYLYFRFP